LPSTFIEQASRPGVALDGLLLAAAAEFGRPNDGQARYELDRLGHDLRAARVGATSIDDEVVALLGVFRRHEFRVAHRVSPDDALLDAVLVRRAGHQLLLAAVCSEVGRRAGLDVVPVRGRECTLVGVRADDDAVVIDPTGECCACVGPFAWMCAHEVACGALSELSRLFAMHGRIDHAIHAAELRAALPLSPELRERSGFEADALRARLN
jgi:hypothetical protein